MQTPYRSLKDQVPITRVRDLRNSIKVEVMDGPSEHRLSTVLPEFVGACHRATPEEHKVFMTDADVRDALNGKGLTQAAETIKFTLRISGVSRILTHQLVRLRVGVTFSQQCTGDQDLRHADFVLPPTLLQWHDNYHIDPLLEFKRRYAKDVDFNGIAPSFMRYELPEALSTFIYADIALSALAPLVDNRRCTMSQAMEMVLLARAMEKSVTAAYPFTESAWRHSCEAGTCWWNKTKYAPHANTHWWRPDAVHGGYDRNLTTVHEDTQEQAFGMDLKQEFPDQHYVGKERCDEDTWRAAHNEAFGAPL